MTPWINSYHCELHSLSSISLLIHYHFMGFYGQRLRENFWELAKIIRRELPKIRKDFRRFRKTFLICSLQTHARTFAMLHYDTENLYIIFISFQCKIHIYFQDNWYLPNCGSMSSWTGRWGGGTNTLQRFNRIQKIKNQMKCL